MTVELIFESRSSVQVLRQDGAAESEPVISLQLQLTGGPRIYTSASRLLNNVAWSMKIFRHSGTNHPPGWLRYVGDAKQARCAIDVHQSPERYAALLDMFRGGHVSEMTVMVEGLNDQPDYSKRWDTAANPSLTVQSICFEFPLPQSDA
ncbi:hypothetical protein [Massilia sp. PWRC2]|uniref:hypothetical protein n=1 Tax=Massilia sp. PWRC2 TaxID=2804626 RepID=UPI003CF8870A